MPPCSASFKRRPGPPILELWVLTWPPPARPLTAGQHCLASSPGARPLPVPEGAYGSGQQDGQDSSFLRGGTICLLGKRWRPTHFCLASTLLEGFQIVVMPSAVYTRSPRSLASLSHETSLASTTSSQRHCRLSCWSWSFSCSDRGRLQRMKCSRRALDVGSALLRVAAGSLAGFIAARILAD